MGGMQLLFSTQYWMDEKRTLLIDNADDIAKHTAVNTFQVSTDANGKKQYAIQDDTLAPVFNLLSTAIQSQVLITDNGGKRAHLLGGHAPAPMSAARCPWRHVQGKTRRIRADFFTVGTLGDLYRRADVYRRRPHPGHRHRRGHRLRVCLHARRRHGRVYLLNNLQVFLPLRPGRADLNLHRAVRHDLPDGAPSAPDGGRHPQLR